MEPKVWISKIEFSDSSKIDFDNNDIIVLVGPNNAGKSATLKEASNFLITKNTKAKVIKSISFSKSGSISDLNNFIESISIKEYSTNPEPYFKGLGFRIYGGSLNDWWNN